jgi:hypothetical protein
MLTGHHNRVGHGLTPARQAGPDTGRCQIITVARRDPHRKIVSLILDAAATAGIAMFAVAAHAGEREAHVRDAERYGQNLPDGLLRQTQPSAHRRPPGQGSPGCEPSKRPPTTR